MAASAGGFSAATFTAFMKGGESGPVVVAGKPDESKLVQLIEAGVFLLELGHALDIGITSFRYLQNITTAKDRIHRLELQRWSTGKLAICKLVKGRMVNWSAGKLVNHNFVYGKLIN